LDGLREYGEMNLLDKKAFEIIMSHSQKGGIVQSELWKMLGVDSKEGSKIVLRLLRRGLIARKEINHNGRKTYVLMVAHHSEERGIDISIDDVIQIPCFTCEYLYLECGDTSKLNPSNCVKLDNFIKSLRR
jgi:DNA-binding Lrp family transcriptional regulator